MRRREEEGLPVQVEDVLAIQKLLADYNHQFDSGEAEAWADLFADDGIFDPGMLAPITTRAGLVEFCQGAGAMIPGARHVVSNVSIDVTGDTATAKSYLNLWVTGENGQRSMLASGRYADELVKVGGAWKLSKRVHTPD